MRDLNTLTFNATSEKIVDVLCQKTGTNNRPYFRLLVAYNFAKVASMMRINVHTAERGEIPINMFAFALATSGEGKGYSAGIMDDEIMSDFMYTFTHFTFPALAQQHMAKIATKRSMITGQDPAEILLELETENKMAGPLMLKFTEATSPALKQYRHKYLLADAGALCLEIDEIGSNIVKSIESLTVFLELYDQGKTGNKLIKHSGDNSRVEEIIGKTPSNLFATGTPATLLNGAKEEQEFDDKMSAGYPRRSLFAYSSVTVKEDPLTAQQILDRAKRTSKSTYLADMASKIGQLADIANYKREIIVEDDVAILWIKYRLKCEKEAKLLGDYDHVRSGELAHRYFKTIKIAGAFAFIDGSHKITEDILYEAIALAEESGKSLNKLLNRDGNYVKLAKYLASVNKEVTIADLAQTLPFYKGSASVKQELLTYATAWGYKNNVIIKKSFVDGIEFLSGESLAETDLDEVIISYSGDLAKGYEPHRVKFSELHKLTQHTGLHWCNHAFLNKHRAEENAIPGFNMLVLDIDSGVSLTTAKLLLQKYKCMFYTTKRHTVQSNRFRIIMPMNYELKLDKEDFKEFMQGIFDWLPFSVDAETGQRSRKWLCHAGSFEYQDGEIFDALPFIPKTKKNEERRQLVLNTESMTNIERWFLNKTGDGNRSNQLIKYALMLVDAGKDYAQVHHAVQEFNRKLPSKMSEREILSTIMVSTTAAIDKRPLQVA